MASEWSGVMQSLALQLLGVPRQRWSEVPAVQALVQNLAAEREAVMAFLHRTVDEVGPWRLSPCLDVWSAPHYCRSVGWQMACTANGVHALCRTRSACLLLVGHRTQPD